MNNLSYISNVLRSIEKNEVEDFADSFSNTQYISKQWLVNILSQQTKHFKKQPRVLILGGWYGSYLVPMLKETIDPETIILTDKNIRTVEVAALLHHGSKDLCKFMCVDVEKHDQRLRSLDVDIVINTSCEHMHDMSNLKLSNSKCLYVFQSCDSTNDPGHINPSGSLEELELKSGISNMVFKGTYKYPHKNRFMVIGFK
jgi:hypothetical protein